MAKSKQLQAKVKLDHEEERKRRPLSMQEANVLFVDMIDVSPLWSFTILILKTRKVILRNLCICGHGEEPRRRLTSVCWCVAIVIERSTMGYILMMN
jgi:hypothetical protein